MTVGYSLAEITKIPKADLHVHIDGSIRIGTLVEFLSKDSNSSKINTVSQIRKELENVSKLRSLACYLKIFNRITGVLQTAERLRRVTMEFVEDAACDGVRVLEARFCPSLLVEDSLEAHQVVEIVLDALYEAGKQFRVKTGLIISALRDFGPDHSLGMARLALKYQSHGVIALDLAGNEEASPAKDHKKAFELAKDQGLSRTLHAGEADGPFSIEEAIKICHSQRVGHGTSLIQDPVLADWVKNQKIPLEICPSSNIHTGAANSLKTHPISNYVNDEHLVTINTDNRLVSNTSLSREIWLCQSQFNWTKKQVNRIIANGHQSSFIK